MDKQNIGLKERDQFFDELLRRCQHKDCCSLIDTIEKMGVTYEEAKRWAESNEDWAYKLEWCQNLCAYHAEKKQILED